MRVERLGNDKIKIFLTFDDLSDRDIKKEDLWNDVPKVHDLFNEIMEQAYEELGFELTGPVAVEIFALPAQGMVVIVSKGKNKNWSYSDLDDDLYPLEVTLEESDYVTFAFRELEDLIMATKSLRVYSLDGGALYYYQKHYILLFEQNELAEENTDNLIALLSEFGEITTISKPVLDEYGTKIIEENATSIIENHFN